MVDNVSINSYTAAVIFTCALQFTQFKKQTQPNKERKKKKKEQQFGSLSVPFMYCLICSVIEGHCSCWFESFINEKKVP